MEVSSVLSMPYAIVNKPRPVVGSYGPSEHPHTKNNHYSFVSGIFLGPPGGHLTLVRSSERGVVCGASQFRFNGLLLLMSLVYPLGINKTNKLCRDDFYRIGPESAPRHLESMTFASTKVRNHRKYT